MKPKESFEEIPLEENSLQKLATILRKYVPRSSVMLNICLLALQNLIPPNLIQMRIYKFEGRNSDDDEDPFIVCIQEPNMCAKTGIIPFPPRHPSPQMILSFEKLLDWTKPLLFQSTPFSFWQDTVSSLCEKYAGHTSGRKAVIRSWVLQASTASKLEVASKGDNFTLKYLEQKHVPQLLANWHYGHSESEGQIRGFLSLLPSCGLFVGDDELASYFLVSPFGLSNILFTEENHRGHGYAKKVILWLAREGAVKHGLDSVIDTHDENERSTNCLKSCGFESTHKITVYWFEP